MERAHYVQERSLPELKDLLEKKIFSKDEIRQIVKKRAAFEAALVRRIARKSDFLKYVAYEMDLEALRKKRVKRLRLGGGPPSVSDYALVRKQFFIFERAVAKFKSDLGLWVQYIQLAKKEGAKGLASRICARALQLHPTAPPLFILSSAHEFDQFSPESARSLLQRGLRLNPESIELWTEYVKMELTYIESLRRRWEVLGIDGSANTKGKKKGDGEIGTPPPGDESDESRRQVMQGAVVLAVMASAVKALPTIQLFSSLQSLLTSFPIPTPLRSSLLEALHAYLAQYLPHSAAARFLHAIRGLSTDLDGEELVDALREANEELVKSVRENADGYSIREGMRGELGEMYAKWVKEWTEKLQEENMGEYLLLSLQSLVSGLPPDALSPTMLTLAIELTAGLPNTSSSTSSSVKALKLARKYTTSSKFAPAGIDAEVWLARLNVERSSDAGDILKLWAEARRCAIGAEADVVKVWLWGIPLPNADQNISALSPDEIDKQRALFDELLPASQIHTSSTIHDAVLLRYLGLIHPALPASSSSPTSPVSSFPRRDDLVRILTSGKARPSAGFWGKAFEVEASMLDAAPTSDGEATKREAHGVRAVLEAIYNRWRDSPPASSSLASNQLKAQAGLRYAEWLLRVLDDGKAASNVIRTTLATSREFREKDEIERRWSEVLTSHEGQVAGTTSTGGNQEIGAPDIEIEMD